jgi:hypothetical protein
MKRGDLVVPTRPLDREEIGMNATNGGTWTVAKEIDGMVKIERTVSLWVVADAVEEV